MIGLVLRALNGNVVRVSMHRFSIVGKISMSMHLTKSGIALIGAFVLSLQTGPATPSEKPKSFEMTISLPSQQMHVGEQVVVDTVTSNPTDHEVYAGEGRRGGIALELFDASGMDIGRHVMGNYKEDQEESPVILSSRQRLRPGYRGEVTFRWKPDAGYLVPGVYKLRVYRRDLGADINVYSNTVTLTVLP
jgi:hypothetical protein